MFSSLFHWMKIMEFHLTILLEEGMKFIYEQNIP